MARGSRRGTRSGGRTPPENARLVPAGYRIVGDIAVVSTHPGTAEGARELAGAIVARHRNVRTVLSREPIPRGDCRVPGYAVISGRGTETVHREFGFTYHLDLSKVFFDSRLASERARVAATVEPGERVLVPFAGIGPFVVPVAARGAFVTAVENNPHAVGFLRGNCEKNGVSSHVTIREGDFFSLLPALPRDFDRAIVPAPYGRDDALPLTAALVGSGGKIHFYTFKKGHEIGEFTRRFEDRGLVLRAARACGNVAPGVSRYCLEFEKR
ncbi:MAG: hypothetical protein QFX32_02040 [Methanolinea sp.]|nr:hypothetical protein [Methanolinea sp.]